MTLRCFTPPDAVCSLNRKLSIVESRQKDFGTNDAHSYRCRHGLNAGSQFISHAAEVGSGDNWHPGEELTHAVRRAICSTA